MRNLLIATIAILITSAANGQDFSSNVVTGNWGINSTWVGGVAPNGALHSKVIYINTGHTITITSGGGADLNTSSELHIWGKLVIEGTFKLDASTVHVYTGGELQIIPDKDNGAVEVKFTGASSIINEGTLSLDLGDVANLGGSTINNTGTMTIEDELENAGGITNSGSMTINGPVTNSGTIDNSGSFTAPSIDNTGEISNSGTIDADITGGGDYVGIAPLPIELIKFNAYELNSKVVLHWTTATELNNDYFTIERSQNGIQYETIATISGSGNSMSEIDYSFTDNNPHTGISYYRLTQTDYNGQFEVFSPVSVSSINNSKLSVGPNPANNLININLGSSYPEGNINIYNTNGAIVKQFTINKTQLALDVSDLNAGMYILNIQNGTSVTNKPIMIQ